MSAFLRTVEILLPSACVGAMNRCAGLAGTGEGFLLKISVEGTLGEVTGELDGIHSCQEGAFLKLGGDTAPGGSCASVPPLTSLAASLLPWPLLLVARRSAQPWLRIGERR